MNNTIGGLSMLVMGMVFTGTYSEQSHTEPSSEERAIVEEQQLEFEDLDDRFSYAYGIDLAHKFEAEGIELNVALLAEAMDDVFSDGNKRMSSGEVAATMEIYRELFLKKKEKERAIAGERNQKEGAEFLAQNATQHGVEVTESGLQYKVINEGSGGYTPTENDEVTVHYRGMFVDGTEFDNTYERGEAYSVKVKQLIDGWAEALQMMSEGSKWELYIPTELAYGERGSGQHIGPNATLIFEVEVLDIKRAEKES